MVLLELGLVKLAATGSSGTAIAVIGPPPLDGGAALPTPLDAAVPPPAPLDASVLGDGGHPLLLSISSAASWLWPKVAVVADEMGDCCRELGASAVSAAAPVVTQAGIPARACELLAAGAAAYCALSKYGIGLMEKRADELNEDEEEEGTVRRWTDLRIYPIMFSAFAVSDIFKITALVDSIGAPLAVPLRAFAIGGLLLSFPTDFAVAWAKKNAGFRKALFIELAACTVSLFWLTWGTHLLSVSPGDAVTAPLLFWSCFVHCVLTWSGFSSIIAITILSSAVTAWASTTASK